MNHTHKAIQSVTALAVFAFIGVHGSAQMTWFVDADAAPGGDGLSWASAFDDLQPAMELALPEDAIWVAEGVYVPSVIGPLGVDARPYFTMPDGVAILGGFRGDETLAEQRDPANFETVLSGDLLRDDLMTPVTGDASSSPEMAALLTSKLDNANLLLFVDRTGPGTRLDGLTLTGLLKTDPEPNVGPQSRGAIFVLGGEIEIANCTITGNLGGANALVYSMACKPRSPVASRFELHPCITGDAPEQASSVLLENCDLTDNFTAFFDVPPQVAATGIVNIDSALTMRDCEIGITTPRDELASFNDLFGSCVLVGIDSGAMIIERSRLFNTGLFGALDANFLFRGPNFDDMDVTIRDSVIEDVDASGRPVIGTLGGSLTIERSIVRNTSTASAAPFILRAAGRPGTVVEISDSVFLANRAPQTISIFPQDTVIRNTTILQSVEGVGDSQTP